MILFILAALLVIAAFVSLSIARAVKKANIEKRARYADELADYNSRPSHGFRSSPDKPELGNPKLFRLIALGLAIIAGLSFLGSVTYRQDEGHASVMRSVTGKVIGEPDTTSGMSFKAPWVKAVKFDTRDNQLKYENLAFSDKNGTSGSISLDLTYNLLPAQTDAVYREYKTQDGFEQKRVAVDVPAALREVTPRFTNVEMMTKPAEVSAAVMDALTKRWGKWGVEGVQIALGNPTYSGKINDRLENLTAEQTRAEEAKAATITAEETAKQRLVEAEAEAKSNQLLEKSLTKNVLENRRIEMLKSVGEKGNLIITDGNAQPLLNVDAKKKQEAAPEQ